MSAPAIKLTRNACGLARLPLIGGRYDGEQRVAIIGAPVCIPIKPAAVKKSDQGNSYFGLSIFGVVSQTVEGDEWKGEQTKDRPENRTQRFALYAPKIENGRASLALYFVEEVEL